MKTQGKFWMIALAFISFMSISMPHHAHAQATTLAPSEYSGLSSDMDCTPGNTFDQIVQNNRTAYQQEVYTSANKVGSLFPVQTAINACFTNIMNAFQSLPGLGNPITAVISQALISLLTNVINGACSQVMGLIQSAQQDLINLTKICLPLPSFGSLQLPNIGLGSCSGSLSFSPLSSFQPVNRPGYSSSSYQGAPR